MYAQHFNVNGRTALPRGRKPATCTHKHTSTDTQTNTHAHTHDAQDLDGVEHPQSRCI